MSTSACVANSSASCLSSGSFRSSEMLRLFRLTVVEVVGKPLLSGISARNGSPPGCSTLITSAPSAPSSVPHQGPTAKLEKSATLIPVNGPVISTPLPSPISRLPCRPSGEQRPDVSLVHLAGRGPRDLVLRDEPNPPGDLEGGDARPAVVAQLLFG